MSHCFSTFKSRDEYEKLNNQHHCVIVGDLNFQTSTFKIPKGDNCEAYNVFLGKLREVHNKVKSGDLSDFSELKL